MIKISQDDALREALSEQAIKKSEKFSTDLIVPKWIRVLSGGENNSYDHND